CENGRDYSGNRTDGAHQDRKPKPPTFDRSLPVQPRLDFGSRGVWAHKQWHAGRRTCASVMNQHRANGIDTSRLQRREKLRTNLRFSRAAQQIWYRSQKSRSLTALREVPVEDLLAGPEHDIRVLSDVGEG